MIMQIFHLDVVIKDVLSMTNIVTSIKTKKDTHSYLNLLLVLTCLIVLQIDAYPVDSRTLGMI